MGIENIVCQFIAREIETSTNTTEKKHPFLSLNQANPFCEENKFLRAAAAVDIIYCYFITAMA